MRVGQSRRRDSNEKAIVEALRKLGAHVTIISGEGAPDVLVRLASMPAGLCWGFEMKSEKGKRTTAQKVSEWPILRSVDEALNAIGIR